MFKGVKLKKQVKNHTKVESQLNCESIKFHPN